MNFQKKVSENGKPATGLATTIIAAGTCCTGHLKCNNDLRIDGCVDADITCDSKVVVGQHGVVTGNIICQQADVSGIVNGNLKGFEQLVLRKGATITGNIQTIMLQMEQGVVFNGQCAMGNVDSYPSSESEETVSFVTEHVN